MESTAPHFDVGFVCPACRGALSEQGDQTRCQRCSVEFPRLESAYADFAPETSFDDFWVRDPATKKHWLEVEAPREEAYELGLAERYVLPLLRRLGHEPSEATVLSAGCGMGSDVDLLNEHGYVAWGIDIGNRVLRWGERHHRARLARADIREMPFPDDAFDFVLSLNTIEHIGTVGDSTRVTEDYYEQRLAAMRSLLRVTKPGGHILLSGLTRTIPFDFGHVQDAGFVRIHSPWEKFLLNYRDVKKLCADAGDVDWTEPLPLRGFFSWTRLGTYRLIRPLLPVVDWLFGSLPSWVYGSSLCPFWIVLVRRRPGAAP